MTNQAFKFWYDELKQRERKKTRRGPIKSNESIGILAAAPPTPAATALARRRGRSRRLPATERGGLVAAACLKRLPRPDDRRDNLALGPRVWDPLGNEFTRVLVQLEGDVHEPRSAQRPRDPPQKFLLQLEGGVANLRA